MGLKAGTLLWRRMKLQIPAPTLIFNTDMPPAVIGLEPGVLLVDTGLIQQNLSFPDYSPGEPSMGATVAVPPGSPPFGSGPVSRIQVMMEASPLISLGGIFAVSPWAFITHSEPFVNPASTPLANTINVLFKNSAVNLAGDPQDVVINALFWDPHSIVGPGQADRYNFPPPPPGPF